VPFRAEAPPVRDRAVAEPGGRRPPDGRVEIAGCHRPCAQARIGQLAEPEWQRAIRAWLGWVGGDDLQIGALTQRQQRIMRAEARMLAAERRPHASLGRDALDGLTQIRAGIDQVVNGGCHEAVPAGRAARVRPAARRSRPLRGGKPHRPVP
jgi:hypothetical protein